MHLFDIQPSTVAYFIAAFREIAATGLGPQRGRAELLAVTLLDETQKARSELYSLKRSSIDFELEPVTLPLIASVNATRMRIEFLTPTELRKEATYDLPEFGFLFARLRDRISNLRAFYGGGPLDLDFAAIGERARAVSLLASSVEAVGTMRTSRRTGQTHSIGGFTGTLEYGGQLDEFLPYFAAARWTGVGRHAVWGNGEIAVSWS